MEAQASSDNIFSELALPGPAAENRETGKNDEYIVGTRLGLSVEEGKEDGGPNEFREYIIGTRVAGASGRKPRKRAKTVR